MIVLFDAPICDQVWAWGDSWEAIQRAAGEVSALEAGFTQEKHLPILARPLVSRGRMLFRSPDALRWEYLSPIRNVLLMHQGKTARYVFSDGEWMPDRTLNLSAMDVVMEQIAGWLGGQFQESSLFHADLVEGPTIVMRPKDEALARMIQRIELKLAAQAGLMESVTIYEGPDAYTRMVFNDAVLNPDPDEIRFRTP